MTSGEQVRHYIFLASNLAICTNDFKLRDSSYTYEIVEVIFKDTGIGVFELSHTIVGAIPLFTFANTLLSKTLQGYYLLICHGYVHEQHSSTVFDVSVHLVWPVCAQRLKYLTDAVMARSDVTVQ